MTIDKNDKRIIEDLIDIDFPDVMEHEKLTEDDTRRDGSNLKFYKTQTKKAKTMLRNKKSFKPKKRTIKNKKDK